MEGEEKDGYDGPAERDSLEFEKIKDPALGYVPSDRLVYAIDYTENQKKALVNARTQGMLLWTERGPIYDTVGPSNGNTRAGVNYTSGRIITMLVDTKGDPTGNTVFAGGVAGGLWKTTNFLSAIPNWKAVDDYFDNMAISSICQNPANPDIMYFSTGEPTVNADAVNGGGIWKSVDHGQTWKRLAGTNQFVRSFKILCDGDGNVYLAARTTTSPVLQTSGLLRSEDGGQTWTNITPNNLTSNASCQDIDLSSTGRLHASFGYRGTSVNHRYTDDPANVSSADWKASTGIRLSGVVATRMELDCIGNTLYAVTVNSSNNIDSAYKSIDGGATWTKQNTVIYAPGLTNGQGWYNVALAINPDNTNEFIVGGLDAYRTTNSGQTITKITNWVSTAPYVHADHHHMQWMKFQSGESRVMIACDGGIFLSRNGGVDWMDKNRNLAIKQFYAAAIHPAAGSNYLLAGAQDNGTHQLKYAGLSSSVEVTGGDGCYVHINQKDPNIQFGSYVYNQYRRSTNGGQSWSSINFSSSAGMFVNPFDYDDTKNIMYASWGSNSMLRWTNANTSSTGASTITLAGLGVPSAFKVSTNTADRVYVGSNSGRLYRVDNASVAPVITNITGSSFPVGFINCVNTGTSDNYLVAVYTNYGVNNIWYSKDAGASWTAIDGNLPDMPVRWATFVPGDDEKLIIATESGVFTTQQVNGSNTAWTSNPGFPTVRTDMLKIRTSDNTIVAATHGRGLFTAVIPTTEEPQIVFSTSGTTVNESGEVAEGCRSYKDYTVNVGILNPASGDATLSYYIQHGSTATKGVDFDYTTNGDFKNPSDQHVFSSGNTAVKVLTVRIYDDAEIESTENFTIGFTISGETNALAGGTKTHQFTINDNELPAKVYGTSSFAIGTYNTDLNELNTPFEGTKVKHRLQALYTATELKAMGLDRAAAISAMNIRVKTKKTTAPFKGFTISMANTGVSSLGNYVGGTFTIVYTGDYNTVQGDNNFQFIAPFQWDGKSNIVVQFCFDNSATGAQGVADVVEGNSSPLGLNVRGSVYSNHTTATAPGCSISAAYIDDYRVNAVFAATLGNKIATAEGATGTEYLNATNDIYYYSATGEVLARVRNLSATNFACTQVMIDREGTSVKEFWNSSKKNFLMDKTYRILPATTNATGKYEVTFYFTKEEKDGFEKATGISWNDIQIVNVSGQVKDITPSNANPSNNGTVQDVVNTVKGTFGDGYTLTGTFKGSFGGFGFGTPGRMFNNLTVKADKVADNGQTSRTSGSANNSADIEVSWTTANETNSSYFEVEKSYDGVTFRKIATVTASGNKFTSTTYSFIDKEKVEVNYYRIKMMHTDNYVIVSPTVLVKNTNAVQNMYVMTNPFRNMIKVRFAKIPETPMVFTLYDMSGKMLKTFTSKSTDQVVFDTNTDNVVSHGVYLLDVLVDGKHYKAKVVKE